MPRGGQDVRIDIVYVAYHMVVKMLATWWSNRYSLCCMPHGGQDVRIDIVYVVYHMVVKMLE